ncbi:MAG: HAMP domain-containing histidine kinase [Dehalococcoidia bacterium]|nr:HAMP domain-containing histidine kinase [Dehalococcoidia bacterium]
MREQIGDLVMRVLQFIGRWAWVSVIAVTLLFGFQFLRAVSAHEDSSQLESDIRGLRTFQERMLQMGVSEWVLGATTEETGPQIAAEADAYVMDLIAEYELDQPGGGHVEGFGDAMIASLSSAIEALQELSLLKADVEPGPGELESLGRLFGVAAGAELAASPFAELASSPAELKVVYGALSYTAASSKIARHLDAATLLASEQSDTHFSELRRSGELGLFFLMVGGALSAFGYAWAGHRERRIQWEVERASERAALGSEFVSLASHELRTPLVGIYGFSELLLEDDGLRPNQRDWVERIHKESGRLTRIVEDLLDVSRIEAGRLEVRREAVDFGEVLDTVYGTFEGASPRHHLRIRGNLGVQVVGDHDKLIEVLSNLVDNAIKYSVDGGLVVIEGRTVGGRFEVRVIDEGVGIPEEERSAIFERFGRLRRSETEHVRSTGLGLYLVQELLGLMDTTISVESNKGAGSTFVFDVPLVTEGFVEALNDELAA